MDKDLSFPFRFFSFLHVILTWCFIIMVSFSYGQDKTLDDKIFKSYNARYFKPKRGPQYNLFLSPVLTVDPLGIGGKSTYGLGAGTRINLWESKAADNILQGLRIKGLYMGLGYEFFPQQSDNLYATIWLRVKTFMPITLRRDMVYSYGYGLRGVSARYCIGFEVKNISVLLAGTTTSFYSPIFGEHPYLVSPYANVGSIILVIPVYNHFPQFK